MNYTDFLELDYDDLKLQIRKEIEKSSKLSELYPHITTLGYNSLNDMKYFLEISVTTSFIVNYDSKIEIDINNYIQSVCDIFKMLSSKKIPESYSKSILRSTMLRDKIIDIQGYSLISKDWIKPLANWIGNKKCLEIMAGKGTLSYALKKEGVDVIATDNFSWDTFDFNELWTYIEKLDAVESVDKYGGNVDIIIMSWCYMNDLGYRCLKKMREVNPNAVMIYIGEGEGGCTGNDDLYREMEIVDDSAIYHINQIYPKWFGIHDRLYLIK